MPRNREAFSILKMKDIFDDCSETLFSAIKKQNPDINTDAFDMALRQLVMNFGSSPVFAGMNEVLSSIKEPTPMYIEAADVLVLARKAFIDGDLEESLKLFALSNETDNVDDLYDALALNNSKSELGVIHASVIEADESDENDENEEDNEDYSVEEDDTPLYDLRNSEDENGGDYDDSDDNEEDDEEYSEDDEDSEDEEIESKVKLIARTLRLHAEEDEENGSEENQVTDNEETEENEPMGGTSSSKTSTKPENIQSARMLRIAANKMSLDGSEKSLTKAGSISFKKAS